VIEQHRDRRAESFFRGVSINRARATIPTHDHAVGRDTDNRVARNIDDALETREFVSNTGELFARPSRTGPNHETEEYLSNKKNDYYGS
jgi:hypothetical protein